MKTRPFSELREELNERLDAMRSASCECGYAECSACGGEEGKVKPRCMSINDLLSLADEMGYGPVVDAMHLLIEQLTDDCGIDRDEAEVEVG